MFELTNIERKCLGLREVKDNWIKIEYENTKKLEYEKNSVNKVIAYYEGNIIKKYIDYFISDKSEFYLERDDDIETTKNRTYAIGKKNKKEYKITRSYLSNEFKLGTKMTFCFHNNYIFLRKEPSCINYYYSLNNDIKNFKDLKVWLNKWVSETTEEDIKDIENFLNTKHRKQKIKNGDIFRFKIDRREYGYGRIVDILYSNKNKEQASMPDYVLLSQQILVEVYKIITNDKNIKDEELMKLEKFPSQYISKYPFTKGEIDIISNIECNKENYPINYSIAKDEKLYLYLKQGNKIKKKYIENINDIPSKIKKYVLERKDSSLCAFGCYLDEMYNLNEMKRQIKENFIVYKDYDLRSPKNKDIKDYLFNFFDFDN